MRGRRISGDKYSEKRAGAKDPPFQNEWLSACSNQIIGLASVAGSAVLRPAQPSAPQTYPLHPDEAGGCRVTESILGV
ncbi:hypothetical protein NDU88_007495 [Pleurodeles waltl]|uniref:Uncharacterized protein n=1 Tax=Pleurodeles waltl TaxID=8319 RepID=A0AAV7ST27_PLEWA|nr:hypothetical protein NDU88_007495 [Pleurodeles waltl]